MSKFTQISKFQGQKGRGLGHVTHFYILGPHLYLWNGYFKFGVQIDLQAYKPTNQEMQK